MKRVEVIEVVNIEEDGEPLVTHEAKPPHESRWRALRFDLFLGIVLCLVLALVAGWIGRTTPGLEVSQFAYKLLQGRLTPHTDQIVILDIGDLKANEDDITPRDKLLNIVRAVAKRDPASIGIDIDFSPKVDFRDGTVGSFEGEKADFDFLTHLAEIPNSNVFVGVYRTMAFPAKLWLCPGDMQCFHKFQKLGAALWIPVDASRIPMHMGEPTTNCNQKDEARTMSFALASWVSGNIKRNSQRSFCDEEQGGPFTETTREVKLNDTVVLDEPLVDYSLLRNPDLIHTIVINGAVSSKQEDVEAALSTRPDWFKNKMVLLGNLRDAQDYFMNPVNGKRLQGVYFHAAAAQSLVENPLRTFREWTAFWMDFCAGMLLFMVWLVLKYGLGVEKNEVRLLTSLFLIGVALVLVFAYFVKFTHILWDDFLLVAAGLAVHPLLHRNLHHLVESIEHRWHSAKGEDA